ncbi:MAG: asparagine synthase-related protein [Chloroflexota bacterium]
MGGLAVIYERSNAPLETGALERVLSRLAHRGPDGRDEYVTPALALGHWHFWTTPEELGERQPLQLVGLPFWIVFDGRLDDRAGLLAQLGTTDDSRLSDAALVLYAYDRWGADCLPHLLGEFAFILFDESRRELFCARDPLGDRTLFYSSSGARFVAASEPWAVAASENTATLNETAVAHFFALRAAADGQTLFSNVYELLPAHGMLVHAGGLRQWRYWQPEPSTAGRNRRNVDDLAEEFLALLEQAVRSRLRASTPVGVLMSGGLDSGSVACLAARMLAPEPLTAISYVFDDLKACDEREYIQTMVERYGIRSLQVPCDDAWPWKDWAAWPRPHNQPETNAYRLLKERAYRRAHEEGLRVLMHGAFGDELYSADDDWLAHLLRDGRLPQAARELARHLRYTGWRATLRSGYLKRALRGLGLGPFLSRASTPPAWLTPAAAALLEPAPVPAPAFELWGDVLGLLASQDAAYENFNANRHALELRHPYRDRRLVEFALGLPAYLLYNRGFRKYILRVAMRDILPPPILARRGSTSLLPLFVRGQEREQDWLQACVQIPQAAWSRYVRSDWLKRQWETQRVSATDGTQAVVFWLCLSYSSWFQSYYSATE